MNFTLRISLIALLLFPLISIASYPDEVPSENFNDFQYPKSGVFIVPSSDIQISKELRNKISDNSRQMKNKGYYDSKSWDAKALLSMKGIDVVSLQNKGLENSNNYKDTRMKRKISEIELAFNYPGVPSSIIQNSIGFAAAGAWIEGKGWTSIKEFFDTKSVGVCSFTLSNMVLAHGNVRIADDSVRYDVNRKPGSTEVYGSNSSGFTYNLSWYDETYSHELECATPKYDKTILNKMIAYGNLIDKRLIFPK